MSSIDLQRETTTGNLISIDRKLFHHKPHMCGGVGNKGVSGISDKMKTSHFAIFLVGGQLHIYFLGQFSS